MKLEEIEEMNVVNGTDLRSDNIFFKNTTKHEILRRFQIFAAKFFCWSGRKIIFCSRPLTNKKNCPKDLESRQNFMSSGNIEIIFIVR